VTRSRRRLSIWALVPLALAFLLIPQTVTLFAFGASTVSGEYRTERTALAAELLPDLGGAVLAVLLIWWLRWGRVVLVERRRTRRWVWVVPMVMVAFAIAVTDYANLMAAGPRWVLLLGAATLCTGLSEELMFRGIALQAFRDRTGEGWAAALSSLFFGAIHLVNALVYGAGAIPQAVMASVLGYYLYLTRRASGGLVAPVLVHAAIDFAIFSAAVGRPEPPADTDAAFIEALVVLGLGVLLLVRRRSISPASRDADRSPDSGTTGPARVSRPEAARDGIAAVDD
jgi:CAAX protease family protein